MSTLEILFGAVGFFAGAIVLWAYSAFKKAEPMLVLKAAISGINKLAAFENKTPETLAKAAAEEARMKALKDALKDAAAKL